MYKLLVLYVVLKVYVLTSNLKEIKTCLDKKEKSKVLKSNTLITCIKY